MASAAAVVNRYLLMPNPPLAFCCRHAMRRGVPHLPKTPSEETAYQNRIDQREREATPEGGAEQPQTRQTDQGDAETPQARPVSVRGRISPQPDAPRPVTPHNLQLSQCDEQPNNRP